MRKIIFCILLIVLFHQLYSQEREITITVVDTCGKPLHAATVYLNNDPNVMTEPQLDLLINNSLSHSSGSNIESSITNFDGQANFSNNKHLYAHAMLIGFQSVTISIDSNKIKYIIELPERAYNFSTLIISPKNFAIEWSTFERDYVYYFVEYRLKPKAPGSSDNTIDSSWGSSAVTFTYPESGTAVFFENLAKKLKDVRFKEMVFDFTVTDADSIRVNRIEGIDNKEYPRIKEMFINLDSWKSARPFGKKIAIRYRLKVIKCENELIIDPAIRNNSRTVKDYH